MKQKWMLVALALLAMVALPLVGCKNDSVSEPVKYTVTFNTNGGSAVDAQTVESGKTATPPPLLTLPERATSLLAGTVMNSLQTNTTLPPL